MAEPIKLFAEAMLPRVELVLHPAHGEIVLGRNSKPKATGRVISAAVEIRTFPAYPLTASPARLRAIACQLDAAATALERAHCGQYPLG